MLKQIELSFRTTAMLVGLLVCCYSLPAAELPKDILLWPNGAPGSEGKIGDEKVRIADHGERVLSNIHKPSLTPWLPHADKATGCAVIIARNGCGMVVFERAVNQCALSFQSGISN